MSKVFLDTNLFIDLIYRRETDEFEYLNDHELFISPLSYHIFFYTQRLKVPNTKVNKGLGRFNFIGLGKKVLENSLEGPTIDLEDNIQLHSAAEAECDYFLTLDKKLFSMKFFGKTKIVNKFDT